MSSLIQDSPEAVVPGEHRDIDLACAAPVGAP